MTPRGEVARTTVFVADDDRDVRAALRDLLTSDGHDVVEAADGAEALERLAAAADARTALPDLVILDFLMPGFSGLGILRVMRRFACMPPTVILTGFSDPSVETFARNLGAVRVLRKPFDVDELRAIVDESTARVEPAIARQA